MKLCTKCGYVYENRIDNPKSCPECKSRNCLIDVTAEEVQYVEKTAQ